jgi:hypothetical protein
VIYYALRDGGLKTWKRFIVALGGILGTPALPLENVGAYGPQTGDIQSLTRLDAILQRKVLPFLSVVESIPAHPDALSAFVEDTRSRAREAEEQHGHMPLLVLDDLERLSFLVDSRRFSRLLSRLDQVLSADCMAGIVATGLASRLADQLESRAAQTIMIMTPLSGAEAGELGLVNLRVLANKQSRWMGSLPLVIDRTTGLVGGYDMVPADGESVRDQ